MSNESATAEAFIQSILASLTQLQKAGDISEYATELGDIDELLGDIVDAARTSVQP